ncbi:hypothetical protein E3N88_09116 [Mikania micrantha]|uniref:Peptidase A3A domain-containing protein n=1 Tax=Mikania micrantha TaxID=192012 RepID=A0A5N6PI39_9ASTR|nr:hypothetical protein E3N88_09116 [Mikania micrantha]
MEIHHCHNLCASLCLASKYVIPEELWENASKEISVTIANKDTILINNGKEKSSPLTPVALEKSKNEVNEELQSSSSPEANGSGKGTSNPLMADSLPKTEKVSLRPSYAQIIHEPEGSEKTNSRYVTGKPFSFKKFGSLLQAQQEATWYSAEFGKKEILLKVTIFPEPSIKKKERIVEFKKNFSKTAKLPKEEIEEEKDFISLDDFRIIWSKARSLSQDEFEIEHLYTEDKATKSLIVSCPGSSPEMVSLAFSAGLIKFIYPSPNLLEISLFSEGMKKAIKNFRKKIASARDANIFIKCTSTLPDWYQGRTFPSYHLLEVGIAKTRTVNPSKIMNDENKDPENWVNIRT